MCHKISARREGLVKLKKKTNSYCVLYLTVAEDYRLIERK